jgi:hypothetical protein
MLKHFETIHKPAAVAALLLFLAVSAGHAQTPQERVHEMSHAVMPFDMSKTVHIFKMTETGGEQTVVARDSTDLDQVALIRRHLTHEADRFRHGDYSDPARLHGPDMPGLKELEAAASDVHISYRDVPAGGMITYETSDVRLLTAIHRWFGAQLSEHGADARAE